MRQSYLRMRGKIFPYENSQIGIIYCRTLKTIKIGIFALMPMVRRWEDACMRATVMSAVKPIVSTASRIDNWIVRVRCCIFLTDQMVGVSLKILF